MSLSAGTIAETNPVPPENIDMLSAEGGGWVVDWAGKEKAEGRTEAWASVSQYSDEPYGFIV
jgi:hypothetical protein